MLVNDAPMATAGLIDHRTNEERERDVFVVGAQRGAPQIRRKGASIGGRI